MATVYGSTGNSSSQESAVVSSFASDPTTSFLSDAIDRLLKQEAGGQSNPETRFSSVDSGDLSSQQDQAVFDLRGSGNYTGRFAAAQDHVVIAGSGTSTFAFTGGANTIAGGSGNLNVASVAGAQSIIAGSGNVNIVTGAGQDTVRLGSGDADVSLGAGNDQLYLGSGNATVAGGTGDNVAHAPGDRSGYTARLDGDGNIVLNDGQGHTALLQDVRVVEFADGSTVAHAETDAEATVARMYEAFFGPDATSDGLYSWWNAVDSGQATVTGVAQAFLNSGEADAAGLGSTLSIDQFVTHLYERVLGREPEQGGHDFWVGALNSGHATRADALAFFAASPEEAGHTADSVLFSSAGGQSPSDTEYSFNILPDGSQTVAGGSRFDVVNFSDNKSDYVVTSDHSETSYFDARIGTFAVSTDVEYAKFADGGVFINARTDDEAVIARMYQAVLDRDADAGGLKFWWDAHDKGSSLEDIAHSFIKSSEFTGDHGPVEAIPNSSFVDLLYAGMLDRTPDQGGHDFWQGKLDSNTMTREQLVVEFAKQAEGVEHEAPSVHIITNV